MLTTPIPPNEPERLAALYDLQILETSPELPYEDLTKLAALVMDCPFSALTFVDHDRQWFKSTYGLNAYESPREAGFCAYTILAKDHFIISDSHQDKRFRNNMATTTEPFARFYAGVPIGIDGLNVGALCVLDKKPREIDPRQIEFLKMLGKMINTFLANRKTSLALNIPSSLQKEAEKKIAHASQMIALAEAAGSLAHEIKNPLASILLSLRGLRNEWTAFAGNNPTTLKFQRIESAIQRINKILRSLETYSRDSREDKPTLTTINDIIEDTLPFCSERLKKDNIELKITLESSELAFECRPVQISQILLNLINNASDAIAGFSKREIEIIAKSKAHFIEIFVTDTGPGVPAHLHDQIFQAFFTTKVIHEGAGLGLSICRKLAENHGGSLEIEPKQDGACFVVKIPKTQTRPIQDIQSQ